MALRRRFAASGSRGLIQIKTLPHPLWMMEQSGMASDSSLPCSGGSSEGQNMATYRLYLLGERHREIRSYKEFDAPSDAQAIAIAEDLRGMETVELWSRGRRVKRFASPFERPVLNPVQPVLQLAS